jgi:hypothetical protein
VVGGRKGQGLPKGWGGPSAQGRVGPQHVHPTPRAPRPRGPDEHLQAEVVDEDAKAKDALARVVHLGCKGRKGMFRKQAGRIAWAKAQMTGLPQIAQGFDAPPEPR